MQSTNESAGGALSAAYLERIISHLREIAVEEGDALDAAADKLAEVVAGDGLIHVFGPGGHSNLATQEIFFRAGGLMNVDPILDEGTLLSNGALRSMAIERTPGYGRVVIRNAGIERGEVLLLVNAYGINAALIDAALEAKELGAFLIGVSSRAHAEQTSPDHPARHPTGHNLHDLVDIAIDTKVPIGDAVVDVPGFADPIAAISTFANAFTLNSLVIRTVARLVETDHVVPVWRSGNAPGGDEANARFIDRFRSRVRAL